MCQRNQYIHVLKRSVKLAAAISFWLGFAFLIPGVAKSESHNANRNSDQVWQANFPRNKDYVDTMPHPDSVYVFIMAGQSNMAGRGFVEPQDTIPCKRILTIDEANNWIYAKEPLHFYEPSMTGLDCGMSFARKLLDHIPEGVSIAMIPTAVGGSSIEQWLDNETHREVALLDNFRNKTTFAGSYGKIKGILWHQGESNASLERIPTYAQKLDSLITLFRKIADNDSLPVLIGELGRFARPEEKQARWDKVNSIIHSSAEKDKNTAVVTTEELNHKGDYVHFDGASQRKLGERFAEKFRTKWAETPKAMVYKQADTTDLKLFFYYPKEKPNDEPYAAIVFFFGGGWNSGNINQFEPHAKHFASKGMVAILAEYRVRERHGTTPFDAVSDAKSVFRYLRQNAELLGIDPGRIAGAGGSAGGHIAAAAAMVPGLDDPTDELSVSPRPDALVLFNPVFDNGPQGYGFERIGDRYMEISPIHNIQPGNPPTIIFLGTNDRLIPVATAEKFRDNMIAAGNKCALILYEGEGHGFFNHRHTENYFLTLAEAERFLISLGYIK